jgi:hypothetical protein
MSVGYAKILLSNNEGQQMKLTHTVEVEVEFDDKATPDYVIKALTTMTETQLKKLLADVFIGALNEAGALETINENNSYARVSWGSN